MVLFTDTSNPPWQQYDFEICARIWKGKPEAKSPGFCLQRFLTDEVAMGLQSLGSQLLHVSEEGGHVFVVTTSLSVP